MFRRDRATASSSGTTERSTGVMGALHKVNPFKSSTSQVTQVMQMCLKCVMWQASSTVQSATSVQESVQSEASAESQQISGKLLGVIQKVNPFKSTAQASSTATQAPASGSADLECSLDLKCSPDLECCPDQEGSLVPSQNPSKWQSVVRKVNPFQASSQAPSAVSKAPSSESLEQSGTLEPAQSAGKLVGMMQKVNPFKSTMKPQSSNENLSSSTGSLTDGNNATEKQNPGKFQGLMQKVNPFRAAAPEHGADALPSETSSRTGSLDDAAAIERHTLGYTEENQTSEDRSAPQDVPPRRTMTFRIKRILPSSLFTSGTKNPPSGSSDGLVLAQEEEEEEEVVEEVRTLQLAELPEPGDGVTVNPLEDEDGLMSWWRTVDGWEDWNEATQDCQAEEEVVEEAADRVFMAARLFVRLFNVRGGTLQRRVLELLAVADAADSFHKRTVTASVGGGVASVAGSVTTITGLILAPFTMGTSLIVTAVGISLATAGGVASASANITDTVRCKTNRQKVEKMIQGYQADMKDISDCLQFLQEGMAALETWDFETYAEVITRSHLNQNVKHVVKEGGRAGKALLINTESLVGTIQILSVSGVAAKATQVMSITTGVMSGLFLALDVFFLAKDSMELKKGAKTEFAVKIREVCQELQSGLLELNNIKEQLQKTMDGIEVEAEAEGEAEDEEELKSSVKKLIELEE